MAVPASQVFGFLDQHRTCSIERREIHSPIVGVLRRNVRFLVARLSEVEDHDAHEIAEHLRVLLSEWLTVPVSFDALLGLPSILGDPNAVERRWGHEIRSAYDYAHAAARTVQALENPARTEVRDAIGRLSANGHRWRVYCHRQARRHFETILTETSRTGDVFLHSVRDYRDVEPFDALIKVGPLRSKGWGSAPDAVLSAPRFSKLIQVVWAGCDDEDGFGYDPVLSSAAGSSLSVMPNGVDGPRGRSRSIAWTRDVVRIADQTGDLVVEEGDADDLRFLHTIATTRDRDARGLEMRRVTLVQIDEQRGILYPPQAQVATFDPESRGEDAIGYRLPSETLAEGMFLLEPWLGMADLGALHAGEGHYSRTWKERLRTEDRRAPDDLIRRLRAAGVRLKNLRACVKQWSRPPSTVIHAPQKRGHFEALVRVLGIGHESGSAARHSRRPWWEYAWAEIGHARGEAIQTGMQEHEIVDEQLFVILSELLPDMRRLASTENRFEIEIPPQRSLTGAVLFHKVLSIEEGFRVPEAILKVICDLNTIEQWRV